MKQISPAKTSPPLNQGMLDGFLTFHIRAAHINMYRHFAMDLANLSLREREFPVLELIDANAGVSQAELAVALFMDQPAMMNVIDRLEGRDLVVRRRSAKDRRRQCLHLTRAGNELLVEARNLVKARDRTFTGLFSNSEAASLIDQLRRIARYFYDDVRAAQLVEVD